MASSLLDLIGSYKVLSPDCDTSLALRFLHTLEEMNALRGAEEKDLKAFNAAANSCVANPQSRQVGLRGLQLLSIQGTDDFFNANSKSWTTGASQCLKQAQSAAVVTEACDLLTSILRRSSAFPDSSRHFSAIAPGLVESLQANVDRSPTACCRCLVTLLGTYPGSCGQAASGLERFLSSQILPVDESRLTRSQLAQIYAVFPRLGGGGRDGIHHREKWAKQFGEFLSSLRWLTAEVISINPAYNGAAAESSLTLPSCNTSNLLKKASFYTGQVSAVCQILREMLQSHYHHPKKISIHQAFDTFDAILQVSLKDSLKSGQIESKVVAAFLPELWAEVITLQADLINLLGEDCLPEVAGVLRSAIHVLSETKGDYQAAESLKSFEAVKVSACNLIRTLCLRLGGNSGMQFCASELLPLLLKEIVPFRQVLTLSLSQGKSGKSKQKRGGGARSEGNTGAASKDLGSSSNEVCSATLAALCEILGASGSLLKASLHKDLQCAVVGLCLEVQQSPPGGRPNPYKASQCRLGLYKVLKALVLNHGTRWTTPLIYAVKIFQGGERDKDVTVAEFCRDAGSVCQAIAQPRSATLHVEMPLSSKEVEDVKTSMMNVHTLIVENRQAESILSNESQLRAKREAEAKNMFDGAVPAKRKRDGEEPTSVSNGHSTVDKVTQKEAFEAKQKTNGDSRVEETQARKSIRIQAAEDDDDIEIDISAEKQEAVMKLCYDFSREPVVIPDEVKNRPKKARQSENPTAPATETKEPEFDMEAAKKLFVPQSSDEEDEAEEAAN